LGKLGDLEVVLRCCYYFLSLSLSAFYFHVFVFALPTAVGNRSLFVFFPFRLVSCYAFRLFVCGCQAFSLDARIFVRDRLEIISM